MYGVTDMNGNEITAYISLGSNIGNRKENLDRAVEMLMQSKEIKVTLTSAYYNTAPVGFKDQPDFLNAAIELKTTLTVEDLFEVCKLIELELKRERTRRWGPRTIDLDILLYGDLIIDTELLTIPHPRMHEREFVLKPLNEIAPEALHPVFQRSVSHLYQALQTQE